VDILERTRGEHFLVVEALGYLGALLTEAKRPEEAIPILERAIDLGERIHTPYADVPAALSHLGSAEFALGHVDLARRAFERALAHPKAPDLGADLGESELGLARISWDAGERSRGIEFARRAQATFRQAGPGELVDERAATEAFLKEHAR
jgi:tetratricopeptide (TPR) repeat protein